MANRETREAWDQVTLEAEQRVRESAPPVEREPGTTPSYLAGGGLSPHERAEHIDAQSLAAQIPRARR